MKIRTDFVTNSSSSSYVAISIKSPELIEILRAAKLCEEAGEFYLPPWEKGNIYRLLIDESKQTVSLGMSALCTICYDEDTEQMDKGDLDYAGCPPENLDGLSKSLLRLLKEAGKYQQYQQGYDIAKICGALEEKGEGILADTESVDWSFDMGGHGEAVLYKWFWILSRYIAKQENLDYCPASATLRRSFHYDRENGGSFKEEYGYSEPHEEKYSDDCEDDWESAEGFSLDDLEFEDFLEDDEAVQPPEDE